ncbi:MAG TPA: hypothetical protein VKQ30_16170 [Ktedonobacterales bacterium]|nr:hypothetical protein [Ktedonobacterales bacterium]
MIVLLAIVTFFSSVDREPFTALLRAPSMEACQAKAAEQSLKASADPEVEGYVFKCIVVPTKS